MNKDTYIRIEGVTKQFPGVTALNNVSFDIMRGEILSVVGENGAGKSTLMNILSGVYQPTSGAIYFDGEPVRFKEPFGAQRNGVAMIHQELSVAPKLTVMENIFIGRLCTTKLGFVDYKTMRERCAEQLLALKNESIGPDQLVGELSTSQRQIVEIAKALRLNAKLIIMDEPTSSLSNAETQTLLEIMRGLRDKGVSILFISHKMDEILEISDRIAVFRDGEYIKMLSKKEATQQEIVSLMVGRTFIHSFQRDHSVFSGEPLLEVKRLSGRRLHDISFKLYKGEVVAVTGLVGSGRTELLESIFGIEPAHEMEMTFEGRSVAIKDPYEALEMGFGLIPEGRKINGIFENMSVLENETICILNEVSAMRVINKAKEVQKSDEIGARLSIKSTGHAQKIRFLSGGNQQKCIIGRWLLTNPKVLLLDEPTHGIDVGAKAEIYRIIDNLAKSGMAILIVSSELPEVLALADRILVMRSGRLVSELLHSEASQESIMRHSVYMKES